MAADANVLLSAVLGHAALKVFTASAIEVVTARPVLGEVREYLPGLAERYAILPHALESQLRLLGVREYDPRSYRRQVPEARRRLRARDPEDVELLALALALRIPVWSNDSDFADARIEWYTTGRLLARLGIGGR